MSATVAIVNSSPLIILSRSGLVELLRLASPDALVPVPVLSELLRRGEDDVTVRTLRSCPWMRVVPPPVASPAVAAWDLGEGESSVIACAAARAGSVAVLDDLQARRCAESMGLTVKGTLGLIVLAKRQGKIAKAADAVEAVRRSGLYVSERLAGHVLRLAGE